MCAMCNNDIIWQGDFEDCQGNTYSEYYCNSCEVNYLSYWNMCEEVLNGENI